MTVFLNPAGHLMLRSAHPDTGRPLVHVLECTEAHARQMLHPARRDHWDAHTTASLTNARYARAQWLLRARRQARNDRMLAAINH